MKRLLACCVVFCAAVLGAQNGVFEIERERMPEILRPAAERLKLTADRASGGDLWRGSPFFYYVISPFSGIRQTPDRYPHEGVPCGRVEWVAARGEYEAASIFVIAPERDVKKFSLRCSELKSKSAVISGSAVDIKVVKNWYQSGTAWHSHFTDPLTRILTPELLLHDESLIRVDHRTKDNFVRYTYPGGRSEYVWMSFDYPLTAYGRDGMAQPAFIADSPALRPAILFRNEFKQFLLTLHVPGSAAPGVYHGTLNTEYDGRKGPDIPVALRVLPFELPRPATNYDPGKEFFVTLYAMDDAFTAKRMANLARHNALHTLGVLAGNPHDPAAFAKRREMAEKAGLPVDKVFATGVHAAHRVADESAPTTLELTAIQQAASGIRALQKQMASSVRPENIYFYGADEGGLNFTRLQRRMWRTVHENGSKVMVSGHLIPRQQFALDYLVMAGRPTPERRKLVDQWHESNPDGMIGWYSDPHSGPENPDYMRRLHGMAAYRMNYDASANYVWYRNDWNDFASNLYEPFLRGLMLVYPTRDDVIDTLAWEGIREGIDDVRYATRLKQLCAEARKSPSAAVRLLGRKASAYLAAADAMRDPLDAMRMEIINYSQKLQAALKGDAK